MARDIKALEVMYNQHADAVFYYLVAMTRNTEDAKDLLQEVFLKMSGVEMEKISNVKAYLITTARNMAINAMKRKKTAGLDETIILESTDESELSREDVRALEKAILGLPAEQKEVIIMKEYQGFTFKEIAEILETSINTVSGRYRYALNKLKEAFKE
jgi:RNA polymerase sigma-70 factor, ECF subfamily